MAGTCSAGIEGGAAVIRVGETTPGSQSGSGGGGSSAGANTGGGSATGGPTGGGQVITHDPDDHAWGDWTPSNELPIWYMPGTPGDPGTTMQLPALSLSDIAAFRPAPGVAYMQPDGWTIAGLHTNFYVGANVQLQHGQVLQRDVRLRFTPIRYHWNYGDGATATHNTPGSTWQALGIREFEATPTSHVYRDPGTYTITLTVDFRVEYGWAADLTWFPMAGYIPLRANDLIITAGSAKTVLVDRDCLANPLGPGC